MKLSARPSSEELTPPGQVPGCAMWTTPAGATSQKKGTETISLTERDILSVSKIMNPATSLPSIRTSFSPDRFSPLNPGIYLPEDGIGVRIEDLVLITEDGCEVLNHYPKDLIIVPFE